MVKQLKTGSNLLAWGRVCVQAFRAIEWWVDCVFLQFPWDALWVVPWSLQWCTEKTPVETYTTSSRMKSSFLWYTLCHMQFHPFSWVSTVIHGYVKTCKCRNCSCVTACPATTSSVHSRCLEFIVGSINEMKKLWFYPDTFLGLKDDRLPQRVSCTYLYWDARLFKHRGQRN